MMNGEQTLITLGKIIRPISDEELKEKNLAATLLIAMGSDEASSDDITVTNYESTAFVLKGQEDDALVYVELKDDEGDYIVVYEISSRGPSVSALANAAGTYRLRRKAGAACAVFMSR